MMRVASSSYDEVLGRKFGSILKAYPPQPDLLDIPVLAIKFAEAALFVCYALN